jgi:molybdate transport system substrate-binding protein
MNLRLAREAPLSRPLVAMPTLVLLLVGVFVGCSRHKEPATVRVAVAANFSSTAQDLARRFETVKRTHVELSVGSTGQLYAQIQNGAPFDVFLAADTLRPVLLESEGLAEKGSRFTYAVGRLVMLAPQWDTVGSAGVELKNRTFQHLAIANPMTAPYGTAARQVLERLGLWDALQDRIVLGESVSQTHQFVTSGAAEVGFVALSAAQQSRVTAYWIVPQDLYDPIRQDAVLLTHRSSDDGARAFLEFLRGDLGKNVMKSFGYEVP